MIENMNITTQQRLATLQRIRKLSRLMDTAFRIPGTPFRFGWDPIIGLLPGLGDVIDTFVSGYLFILALQFKLPRGILGWMIFNIALEAIVGAVPLLGDFFDAYFKSNIRNLTLLEKHLYTVEPALVEVDRLNLVGTEAVHPEHLKEPALRSRN